jgi:hypothetical protein
MSNYYVFEFVFDNEQKSYITYSKAHPKNDAKNIFSSFKSSPIPELNEWICNSKNNDTHEFIELDVVDSKDDAIELVEIWRNYYRFLGLTTLS